METKIPQVQVQVSFLKTHQAEISTFVTYKEHFTYG